MCIPCSYIYFCSIHSIPYTCSFPVWAVSPPLQNNNNNIVYSSTEHVYIFFYNVVVIVCGCKPLRYKVSIGKVLFFIVCSEDTMYTHTDGRYLTLCKSVTSKCIYGMCVYYVLFLCLVFNNVYDF